MKSTIAIAGLVALAAATPDPQITPRAQLGKRQDTDPALLGWVSGASGFYDQRSCDFPTTLSSSGSLAQCCSGSNCIFWSSCSAGTLLAQSTSLRCDQGFCNTAVLVPTAGARSGQNYLGCWPTGFGQDAFTLVRDIGTASAAAPTPTGSSGSASASASASSGSSSRASSSRSSAQTSASGSATSGTAASSATGAAQSTTAAAAAAAVAQPLTGVLGVAAMLFGML